MVARVRVRGIYSTAISKILRDEGHILVDVSDVLVERLGVPANRGLPADVTVKTDNDDTSKLLVIGHADYVEEIAKSILRHVPATISSTPPVGLYSTVLTFVKGLRDGRCFVETPYGLAELVEYRECREGTLLPASVIKVPTHPNDSMLIVPGARVVGDYAVVWRGSKILFSPHLKNKSRVSELLALSSQYVRRGLSIKWRSNADEADLGAIAAELPQLISELEAIEKKIGELSGISVVTKGEQMVFIYLTYDAKMYLDNVRRSVTPTTDYHHIIKTSKGVYRDIAELLDEVSVYVGSNVLRRITRKFMAKLIGDIDEITIGHRKLDGRYIKLGFANIARLSYSDRIELELVRRVRSSGVYDGIRVRKEVDDVIRTLISEEEPYIIHFYLSSKGDLKGVYVSLSSKPEVVLPDTVEYIDLSVDLVRAHNGSCELVDQDEFRSYATNSLMNLSQEVYEYVIKGLEKALENYCS